MILNYKNYGEEDAPAVFFLHGLLGCAENWGSVCRRLSGEGLRCIAVDQRNHGSSPHSPEMSYPLMAEDLHHLADHLNIRRFSIVGHSMGGKTAMEAALIGADRIRSLVVADIAPIRYKPAYVDYINSLSEMNLDGVEKRSDAGRKLERFIPDRNLRMFFLTNLRKKEDGSFGWRINLDGITSNYDHVWEEIHGSRRYDGPVLFLRGGESGFITEPALEYIGELFPSYQLETIDGAGHWVHSEAPDDFRARVLRFIGSTR